MESRINQTISSHYDHVMFDDYRANIRQGGDGFCNFGYWTPETTTIVQAHVNLIELLVEFLCRRNGTLLDVACGKGASTRYLGRRLPSERVVGINISQRQLAACRRNAPGSTFIEMDAASLGFVRDSFDNVVCIEAAFHFRTRETFLSEAFRVLKPGGRLAMSDILSDSEPLAPPNPSTRTMSGYLRCLEKIGFSRSSLVEVTAQCTDAYCDHADMCDRTHLPEQEYLAEFKPRTEYLRRLCRPYVLVHAAKG